MASSKCSMQYVIINRLQRCRGRQQRAWRHPLGRFVGHPGGLCGQDALQHYVHRNCWNHGLYILPEIMMSPILIQRQILCELRHGLPNIRWIWGSENTIELHGSIVTRLGRTTLFQIALQEVINQWDYLPIRRRVDKGRWVLWIGWNLWIYVLETGGWWPESNPESEFVVWCCLTKFCYL